MYCLILAGVAIYHPINTFLYMFIEVLLGEEVVKTLRK
jgi:hypothetical protein